MDTKTLGINLTHDASICVCNNGKIELFQEEERISKIKHDDFPLRSLEKLLQGMEATDFISKYHRIGMTGLLYNNHASSLEKDTIFESVASVWKSGVMKQLRFNDLKDRDTINSLGYEVFYSQHHTLHAFCGFYNSGFDDALVLVVDGVGNTSNEDIESQEVASIFQVKYPDTIHLRWVMSSPKYRSRSIEQSSSHMEVDWVCGIGMAYSSISTYLGFGMLGSGKVMGLAPYGREDPNIKSFLRDDNFSVDSSQFYRTSWGCNFIPYDYLPTRPKEEDFQISSNNFQKLANLAYRLQKDFETHMIHMIKQMVESNISKNIIITGGCALNCVANYEYLNHIPNDFNLYIEPISNDAGTSLGLSKYLYYSSTKSMEKHPLKNLYLGKEY